MKRRDATVLAISAGLAVIVVIAIVYSFSLDRRPVGPKSGDSRSSLLTLTWAPSLCKAEPKNSGCRSGHVGRLGQALVLHGLWPQPSTEQYCGITAREADRRGVDLPPDVRNTLQDMMSDAKSMSAHEWYAHGTCSGVTPPEYFGVATSLTSQARDVLTPVFRQAYGQALSPRVLREAFEASFGRGTGNRVGLSCRDVDGVAIVYEVRLSLPAVVDLLAAQKAGPGLKLGDSLAKGPTIPPGCGKGKVT